MCTVLSCLALVYEGLHVLKLFFMNRFLLTRKALRRESNDSSNNDGAASGQPSASLLSRTFMYRRQHAPETGSGEPAPRSLLEESDHHPPGSETTTNLHNLTTPGRGFLDLLISAVFHSIYVFLGFTLMNAVMTFNVWVLVAISIGVAFGYFCFGNYRRAENLIHPLSTENTSLNDDTTPPPPLDGGGDRFVNQSRTPYTVKNGETEEDPGESSRLIVGAQVHIPRIMSSSTAST